MGKLRISSGVHLVPMGGGACPRQRKKLLGEEKTYEPLAKSPGKDKGHWRGVFGADWGKPILVKDKNLEEKGVM